MREGGVKQIINEGWCDKRREGRRKEKGREERLEGKVRNGGRKAGIPSH